MTTYYVTGNLYHDGRPFARGEQISLTEESAPALIEIGIVSTEPIEAPAPVQEQVEAQPDSADIATVGGEPSTIGEPSFDGVATTQPSEALDITPVIETSPAEVVDPPAPVQEQVEAPRRRGRPRATDATPEPENDPSKDL
jgi:hypothetical protein